MAELDTNTKSNRHAIRAVIGVLAAVVIAFCGWSAYEYANGGDPLAFLGGTAFQTVEEAGSGSSDDTSASITTKSNTVTSDDIAAQIAKLTYGDEDVSIDTDDVKVVISDGAIWMENATDSDAASAVEAAAKRVAALSAWASKQRVSFSRVVWICEDMAGFVRIAIDYPTARASDGETTAQILAGATGYRISGDTYHALGSGIGFDQESGDAPSLPNGDAITVLSDQTSTGEVLQATGETYTVLTQETKTSTSSSGSSSGGTSSNSTSSAITVTVTVDASSVGAGSSSATVSVPVGATVYDALKATGVGINASETQYGIYVSSIGGLAEKEYGGTSGWMYSVNGTTPMVSCGSYTLNDGDTVYWHYVTSE